MSAWTGLLQSYVLNSLWQVPLLFAAGWLTARVARPLGARAEHRVWVGTMLLEAVVPMGATLAAGRVPGMWSWLAAGSAAANGQVAVQMGDGVAGAGLSTAHVVLVGITALYLLATLYLVARFAWRLLRVRGVGANSAPAALTEGAARVWAACCERRGVRDVALRSSENIYSPLTMGIARKIVLMPAALLRELAEPELQAALAHELAHVQRNDFARNLLCELLALPVAYHPLLWATRDRMTETREMICDEMAAEMDGAAAYGRSLLRLASMLVHGVPARLPHAIGIFDANTLERRIMRMKSNVEIVGGARRFGLAGACALLLGCVSLSAVAAGVRVAGTAVALGDEARKSVPSNEMAGRIVSKVAPAYPVEAKQAGIQGTVVLKAVIAKDGSIDNLQVVSGPKELQQSALDAVRQWKYRPYEVNGEAVEVETTINIIYSLEK